MVEMHPLEEIHPNPIHWLTWTTGEPHTVRKSKEQMLTFEK